MTVKNGAKPDVRYLYHGTSKTAPKFIYESEEGFDLRYSPGGMWGCANYFAVNAAYSYNYKFSEAGGTHQIFYAQVIIGNTKKEMPCETLKLPPLLPGSEINRFDSV
jgi:hypothetical protein